MNLHIQLINNLTQGQQKPQFQYKLQLQMISPNHLVKLQEALQMIMGPHEVYKNRTLTSLIKEGEQILSWLRTLPTYENVLCNYLVQLHQDKLKVSWQAKNKNKTFVLLELKKISPLNVENSWWHLVEFFYSCDQKAENQVIELVILHLRMQGENLSNVYMRFLSWNYGWAKGGMFRVAKALTLAYAITSELHHSQIEKQRQISHIEYLAQFLQNLLGQISGTMPNYSEPISICIMWLVMIGHEVGRNDRNSGEHIFREKQIAMLQNTLSKQRYLSPKLKLLLAICAAGLTNNNFLTQRTYQQLPSVLAALLRGKPNKNNYCLHQLNILNYFLTNFQQNINILSNCSYAIIKIYQDYITQVEVRQPLFITLPNSQKEEEKNEDWLSNRRASTSYGAKFHILNSCLRGEALETIIKRSENNTIVLMAYLAQSISPEIQIQTFKKAAAYIKSIVHHPATQSIPIIICCLRYLYLYILDNPNYNLIDISTALINLRLACPSVQQACDILLCKAAATISTTIKTNEILEFVSIWKDSLMQNYMNVTAVSFYPVLLIMETTQDDFFGDFTSPEVSQPKSPIFYSHILELLLDESKTIQSSTANHAADSWCDNFEVFYKWCSVYIKYLTANQIFLNEKSKISHFYGDHNKKIMDTLNKAISYIFQNELYCADSAYLYAMKLISQGPKDGLLDFVNNLMTEAFWRGLDKYEVYFYCCVLVGIVRGFNELFPPAEVYPRFIIILHAIVSTPQFSEEDLTRMKSELTVFFNHLCTPINEQEKFIFNQISAEVTKKSMLIQECREVR